MSEARIGLDARSRAWTVAAVAAIHLATIAALISAFGVDVVVQSIKSIAAFDVPTPPAPEPSPSTQAERPKDAEAPPAPRATPREAVGPKPKVVIQPKPRPSAAATGSDVRSGASAAGAGSGAAGQGAGAGGGGRGGSGGGIVRRAEKVSGELRPRDFPRSGADQRDGRFIVVRYDVGTDGRVNNCRVIQSSGSTEADAITCRLIEKRFRYRPAEDALGNPVADQTGWKQWWWRPA